MADQIPSQRGRRLWTVDLNDVQVHDEDGNEYEVVLVRGALDGRLLVSITSKRGETP